MGERGRDIGNGLVVNAVKKQSEPGHEGDEALIATDFMRIDDVRDVDRPRHASPLCTFGPVGNLHKKTRTVSAMPFQYNSHIRRFLRLARRRRLPWQLIQEFSDRPPTRARMLDQPLRAARTDRSNW